MLANIAATRILLAGGGSTKWYNYLRKRSGISYKAQHIHI